MKIDFMVWLIVALSTSVVANIIAFLYIRHIMSKLIFVGENLSDLVALLNNYKKHLKSVFEMEMYYGDDTLKHLIEHTGDLLEVLKDYDDVYLIATPLEEATEELQEDLEQDAEKTINEENVFYAGTRTSNN